MAAPLGRQECDVGATLPRVLSVLTITVGLAAARLGALVAGAVGEAVRHLLAAPALRYRQMRVQGGRGETQGATTWGGWLL